MVASIEYILSEGPIEDIGCRPYDRVSESSEIRYGIIPRLGEISLIENLGKDPSEVNMRVGRQGITVKRTGVPEYKSVSREIRVVRVNCPNDITERCGNCVMTLLERE